MEISWATIRRQEINLPLPSVLLASEQSIDNKIDKLQARISYQRDIKNWNNLFHQVVAERRHD